MRFSEILKGLEEGKKYTCLRWKTEDVYIYFTEFKVGYDIKGSVYSSVILLEDRTRRHIGIFTPSVENLFYDRWVEVK